MSYIRIGRHTLEKQKIGVSVCKTVLGNHRVTIWYFYPHIFGTTIPYENSYYCTNDLINDIHLIRSNNNEISMNAAAWDVIRKSSDIEKSLE